MKRLIRYEFVKLFCRWSVLAVLAGFSVINLFKIQYEFSSYSYLADGKEDRSWNRVYWQLYEEYRGEITKETIDRLLAVYQPLKEAAADLTANTAVDNPDAMTGNLYSDRNLLEKYFVQPMEYFYHYRSAASKAAAKAKENAALYERLGERYEARKNSMIYHLYSDRQISAFAYDEMYNYYLNYDFSTVLIFFLCLYGIVGVFVCEKETQMDMLLLTNLNGGKKTASAKTAAVSFFVIGVSLWFSALDYAGFSWFFGTMEGYGLPLYAVRNFSMAPVNWSLSEYALISAIV